MIPSFGWKWLQTRMGKWITEGEGSSSEEMDGLGRRDGAHGVEADVPDSRAQSGAAQRAARRRTVAAVKGAPEL